MIESKKIELFRNLCQFEFENQYYDFHNDYDCKKIFFEKGNSLIFLFKNIKTANLISMRFEEVILNNFIFFNSSNVDCLTIDNIYRGKIEENFELIEFSKDAKGYFYLEFYEGQKMQFWSSGISINNLNA